MRQATHNSVTEVGVEIDRPEDRAAKNNDKGSNTGTSNITGSGGSQTIKTNNSNGNWYLEAVSVTASGTSLAVGAVQVQFQVRDGNDNPIVGFEIDPAVQSFAHVGSQLVQPGWDVHMSITQADANTYDVTGRALLRKPDPDTDTSHGGGQADTGRTVYEDFERSTPISDYVGDTGEFGTSTATVYHGDTAVTHNGATGTDHNIVTTSLSDLPSDPFKIRSQVRSDKANSGAGGLDRVGVIFGAADTNNFFAAQLWPESGDLDIIQVDGGGVQGAIIEGTSGTGKKAYPGDEWWMIEVDVDVGRSPQIRATFYDADGNEIVTREDDGAGYSMYGSGIGVRGHKVDAADDHYLDYIREVEE